MNDPGGQSPPGKSSSCAVLLGRKMTSAEGPEASSQPCDKYYMDKQPPLCFPGQLLKNYLCLCKCLFRKGSPPTWAWQRQHHSNLPFKRVISLSSSPEGTRPFFYVQSLKWAIKKQAASQDKRARWHQRLLSRLNNQGLQLSLAFLPGYSLGSCPSSLMEWQIFCLWESEFFPSLGSGGSEGKGGEREWEERKKNVCERQEPQKEHVSRKELEQEVPEMPVWTK